MDFDELLSDNLSPSINQINHSSDGIFFIVNHLISPCQFVTDFQHLPIARVVDRGKLTGKFTEDVRSGKYKVDEGVICKGGTGGEDIWMVKIKTTAYMSKLKQAFADYLRYATRTMARLLGIIDRRNIPNCTARSRFVNL